MEQYFSSRWPETLTLASRTNAMTRDKARACLQATGRLGGAHMGWQPVAQVRVLTSVRTASPVLHGRHAPGWSWTTAFAKRKSPCETIGWIHSSFSSAQRVETVALTDDRVLTLLAGARGSCVGYMGALRPGRGFASCVRRQRSLLATPYIHTAGAAAEPHQRVGSPLGDGLGELTKGLPV